MDQFNFSPEESELISSYLNSYQFELDYPHVDERTKVMKKVMEVHTMSALPIKFSKFLRAYGESVE